MICNACKQNLNENLFSFRNKAHKIKHKICKKCVSLSFKISYQKNKKYYNKKRYERSKTLRNKNKALLIDFKKQLNCKMCGEKDYRVLDFHHIDSKNKNFNISCAVTQGVNWKRILQEINQCMVLCANCHRKVHYNKINGM